MDNRWASINNLGENIGTAACDLIERVMHFDPCKRLSAKQCLAHAYFAES